MKILKRVLWGLLIAGLAMLSTCAGYFLPSTVKVQLTGTEVRRFDPNATSVQAARDVRYIQARRIADDETLVFRNEDTRWGWPPYFKFDAADLSAKAGNILQQNKDATVLITYYGIRSRLLDVYPNATSLQTVPADYNHVPIFNIVFIAISVLVLIAILVYARRAVSWVTSKVANRRGSAAPH